MPKQTTNAELDAYLDEALPGDRMAEIEQSLRDDDDLSKRLASVVGQRDAGVHTLGAIWRRHRLSCPSREELGSYLLNVLDDEHIAYIKFHLDTIGCRICAANVQDLQEQAAVEGDATTKRRHRYFQSSAGYLSKD